MRSSLITLALLATLPLAACASLEDATVGPKLAPIGYPAAIVSQQQQVAPLASVREGPPQPASANSLWRTGARAFFIDQRAGRVGDILTVLITIDDSAKTNNTTSTGRTNANKYGIPHIFGLESTLGKILPSAYDPANAIETNASSTTQGVGSVNRSEQINLTIAAVVTQVMANGNLVIQGSQEVKTNGEVRQLTVAGIAAGLRNTG